MKHAWVIRVYENDSTSTNAAIFWSHSKTASSYDVIVYADNYVSVTPSISTAQAGVDYTLIRGNSVEDELSGLMTSHVDNFQYTLVFKNWSGKRADLIWIDY